jgi:FtsP/CotA-like multicopper oxidase with cupredoxin domain
MDGNYELEVIEIDGVTLKPGQRKTRGIELASGQRVSVIADLTSLDQLRRIMVSLLLNVL